MLSGVILGSHATRSARVRASSRRRLHGRRLGYLVGVLGALCTTGAATAVERARALPPQGTVEEFSTAIAGDKGGTPIAMVAGADGNMWFTESTGKIVRMSPSGLVTGEFTPPSGAAGQPIKSSPAGIAVGPDGNIWFTDTGTDAEGHSFIGTISRTNEVKEFEISGSKLSPKAIVAGEDGNLWFTEAPVSSEESGSIGRISPTGAIVEFKVPASGQDPLSYEEAVLEPKQSSPDDIARGPDGRIWFTDRALNLVTQGFIGTVTPDGQVSEWATEMQWDIPEAIAAGDDGNAWFAGEGGEPPQGYIERITPHGTILGIPLPGPIALEDLAFGPDGNVWFTESVVLSEGGRIVNAIGRMTPTGTLTRFSPISTTGGTPRLITFGAEGNIWFGERDSSVVGRMITPLAPAIVQTPAISGDAKIGGLLSVSNGSWENEPETFSYQWQSCDIEGATCGDLSGENEPTHLISEADAGHALRAVVTATSRGGSSSAASSPSAVVYPVSTPHVAPVTSVPVASAPPVVSAAMTWRFAWSRAYTLVRSLVVHSIPDGASLDVRCSGSGCPFKQRHVATTKIVARRCHGHRCAPKPLVVSHGTLSLAGLFTGRHLKVKARILVTVTESGWVGKSFTFVVRANQPPLVEVQCLAPVSQDLGGGC
jgi:streptogramin lyase